MAHLRRQIRQLRGSIRSLESDRRDMAEKVLELESAKQALHDAQKNATAEKQKLQAVTQKQNVLLELLGEKEEAIECLEDNIATMKTMYRQQTTDLLTRIETLEGGGR